MKIKPAVFLRQSPNMKYNTLNPQPEEPEYIYHVMKVKDSLFIHVGERLYPHAVEDLIQQGWTVTITE